MSLTRTQIAEAFSRHDFDATYPYFLDTIFWNVVGDQFIEGKVKVINTCNQAAEYFSTITTSFSKFSVIVGDDCVVIDSIADYIDKQNTAKIASCDIYCFNQDQLAGITSYTIELPG